MATELDNELQQDEERHAEYDDEIEFRSVSRAAIASIVFAILGISGLLIQPLLGLLLLGIGAGVIGLVSTIRYPDEITGRGVAIAGILLCTTMFVSASAWNTYVYLTEVPEGYQRITWRELQPPKKEKDKVVSDRSLEMNGEQIFIEGYVLKPTSKQSDLKTFILVRDIGACCFGDADPKPTHIMKVDLPAGQTVDWSTRPRKLTGILVVDKTKQPTADVPAGVYYSLSADSHK